MVPKSHLLLPDSKATDNIAVWDEPTPMYGKLGRLGRIRHEELASTQASGSVISLLHVSQIWEDTQAEMHVSMLDQLDLQSFHLVGWKVDLDIKGVNNSFETLVHVLFSTTASAKFYRCRMYINVSL